MRMSRFDWSIRLVKNSVDSCMSTMWFDSNALEMTTAEHCMYLTKFCQLLRLYASACGTVLENLIRELTILGRERRPRRHKTKTTITEIKAVRLCRKHNLKDLLSE